MSAARFLPRVLPVFVLSALVLFASACGGETGFLIHVDVDASLEPGRDYDDIRLEVDLGNPAEPSGHILKVEPGDKSPYSFLVLQGDVRRHQVNIRVYVRKESRVLDVGEVHERGWVFEQGEIVEKTITIKALPR